MEEEIVKQDINIDLTKLSDDELMEFYEKVDEHIKYLNNSVLSTEEEE